MGLNSHLFSETVVAGVESRGSRRLRGRCRGLLPLFCRGCSEGYGYFKVGGC